MAKLVLALLCAAFALSAARQLHQTTALATITDLPENLQKLNARLTAAATSKVHPMSLLDHYEAYERYEKYGQTYRGEESYEETYEADKYAPKYDAADKYAPTYEGADKYAPKYDAAERYAPKYEGADKYAPKYDGAMHAPKYEDKYEEYEKPVAPHVPHHPAKDSYEEYAYEHKDSKDYGYYGPSKVTVKLYEKYRSAWRTQANNNNTFAFTSELTCTDPSSIKDVEHTHDGLISFPMLPDRAKMVTVGVCEWSVTIVKEQQISDSATLKGSTQVVCTFNEEAERHCKNEYLCDKMTVTGQGLVYSFNALPEEPKYADKYQHEEKYEKYATKDEDVAAPTTPASMDVFLSLINGVINTKKHFKWDNGAIQYFAGQAGSAQPITPIKVDGGYGKKVNPIGEYTIIFK